MTGTNTLKASTLGVLLLLFSSVLAAQGQGLVPYQEGLHYFKIDNASEIPGDKVEVLELFSYLCSHCSTFEPYVNNWAERAPEHVNFRRVPVVFGRASWELYARAFVTAEIMNLPEEAHMAMMDRLFRADWFTCTFSFVVHGKFRVSGNASLPSFDAMLEAVDYLVEIERHKLKDDGVAAE